MQRNRKNMTYELDNAIMKCNSCDTWWLRMKSWKSLEKTEKVALKSQHMSFTWYESRVSRKANPEKIRSRKLEKFDIKCMNERGGFWIWWKPLKSNVIEIGNEILHWSRGGFHCFVFFQLGSCDNSEYVNQWQEQKMASKNRPMHILPVFIFTPKPSSRKTLLFMFSLGSGKTDPF